MLTERISGVPVAVIRTPVRRPRRHQGRARSRAGCCAVARRKHWMRTFYALVSGRRLKRASLAGGAREATSKDYWQAGRSVAGIHAVEPAGDDCAAICRGGSELSGLQRPGDLVGAEDDAGRKCFRADELE